MTNMHSLATCYYKFPIFKVYSMNLFRLALTIVFFKEFNKLLCCFRKASSNKLANWQKLSPCSNSWICCKIIFSKVYMEICICSVALNCNWKCKHFDWKFYTECIFVQRGKLSHDVNRERYLRNQIHFQQIKFPIHIWPLFKNKSVN